MALTSETDPLVKSGDGKAGPGSLSARQRRTGYMAETASHLRDELKDRNLAGRHDIDNMDKKQLIQILLQDDEDRKKWVRSRGFEVFFGCIVILNALVIGAQIDNPGMFPLSGWFVINMAFFCIFVAEGAVKVYVLGWRDYISDRWNVFDVVVTIMVAVEMSAYYGSFQSRFYDTWSRYVAADFTQMLRLLRLLRLARVFSELGVLLQSFLGSLQALGWIALLAVLWFYISACIATVFIGRRDFLPSEDQEEIRELRVKFSSIPMSMFSLFEVMTLEGWVDYVRPLIHTRVHMVFFFLFFIFITSFFMLNLVTAVVVDRTVSAQEQMEENEEKEAQDERIATITCITGILKEKNLTAPDQDIIAWDTFDKALDDPEVIQALRQLQWTREFMESMFAMIDYDDDGEASLSGMKNLLEASHMPLDTANYVRFQINLARRLEFQEKITLTVLHALEKLGKGDVSLPDTLDSRMREKSFLDEEAAKSKKPREK